MGQPTAATRPDHVNPLEAAGCAVCQRTDAPARAHAAGPAATLLARFPEQIATELAAHGIPEPIIDTELRQMHEHRLGKTTNRSVIGIMNEFTYLAETYDDHAPQPEFLNFATRLATTPRGPLHSKHVSPDRELHTLLRHLARPTG